MRWVESRNSPMVQRWGRKTGDEQGWKPRLPAAMDAVTIEDLRECAMKYPLEPSVVSRARPATT